MSATPPAECGPSPGAPTAGPSPSGPPALASAAEPLALDDRDAEPRTPMKRLGSTRKLAAFTNIRAQLAEQSRVLEARAEAAAGVAGEMGEYCRRRAELEHEYARALDKLARAAAQRHKDQRHRRDHWPLIGAFHCWQAALEHTRSLARDHAALADLYAGPLAARLQRAADDALRLHRKCRDVVAERHEELAAALAEAGAAGKAHAAAAAEWRANAAKLRHARDQRDKLALAEPHRIKKIKALDKELEKRRVRHSASRARALRARADYVLSLEAANATLQRYYLDDVADIMLCMEVGFEAVVGRSVRGSGAGEACAARRALDGAAALMGAADALDAPRDRQRAVAQHAAAFAPPRPLPLRGPQPAEQDAEMRALADEPDDEASAAVRAELAQRLLQLEAAARQLRAECAESAKTLDAAEAELVRQMEGGDIDVDAIFARAHDANAAAIGAPASAHAHKDDDDAPRRDQEDYYLAKFRSYVSCAGRLARLESKASAVRSRLLGVQSASRASPASPPRRAALRRGLFAAPLVDAHQLPPVLTACVRVIATYGLRHQGVFRVSGSQVEMQALRAAFERGEDPLRRVRDASDINSVCGLLKLYLRSLRPPLVPGDVAERLLSIAAEAPRRADAELLARLREALAALPTPNMIVLRYLAAFLAHLTQHSAANMMDAWNLAVCMGPTLVPARGEGSAQVAQQNLVNDLLKRLILHHRDLFPQHIAPHTLYQPPSESDELDATESKAEEGEGEGDEEEEEEEEVSDARSTGAGEGGDDARGAGDVRDDLSLFADDDIDEDELSSDGENEWPNRDHDDDRTDSLVVTEEVQEGAVNASVVAATAHAHATSTCRRLAEATPDLVLDLPLREAATANDADGACADAQPPSPSPSPSPAAEHDPADAFVHNRDTLKKRERTTPVAATAPAAAVTAAATTPAHAHAGCVRPPSASESSPPPGSPVPPRNTARVAAKFADLTLTGGSLKPALAAKPALLRRPTPHPHHTHTTRATPPPPAAAAAAAAAPAPANTDL